MKQTIIMTRNHPSGIHGRPTLYAGHKYTVDERIARQAVASGAATRLPDPKPKTAPKPVVKDDEDDAPKRPYTPRTKSMTGAPENKSVAASADKPTLD